MMMIIIILVTDDNDQYDIDADDKEIMKKHDDNISTARKKPTLQISLSILMNAGQMLI